MSQPTPICKLGYPESQLRDMFSNEQMKDFFNWMRGQTFSVCDGSFYDHREKRSKPTGCGPHGYVYYPWDVEKFLDGSPIVD